MTMWLVALRNLLDRDAKVNAGAYEHTIVVDGQTERPSAGAEDRGRSEQRRAGCDNAVGEAAVFMTQKRQAPWFGRLDGESAVQTFYLTNPSTQANDAVTAARKQMDPAAAIYYVPATDAVVVHAKPEELPVIGKLLHDLATLANAKPEVPASAVLIWKTSHGGCPVTEWRSRPST